MRHQRAAYLYGYLQTIGAQTIVEETDYTDRAYLDDYAYYYVKSFYNYPRRCRRLHFFSSVFDAEQFRAWILGPPAKSASSRASILRKSYLGCIVVRPLPQAIIGRTTLITYPDDGGRRHYPVTLDYHPQLFGTQLVVKSLAFQEQDTVLAACATVALWSAFQQCARHFGTVAPSPAEITAMATTADTVRRTLPSRGLTLNQMNRAVQAVGLEPEVYECRASLPLNSLIYSYVAAGLPVILVADVDGQGHAVTIAGYSLRASRALDREDMAPASPAIRRIGLRINEWYGHDDQVGPFARMLVGTRPVDEAGKEPAIELTGSWPMSDGTSMSLVPRHVIVPVYHKIRVTFLDVQPWLAAFNRLAAQVIDNFDNFEWDLRLTTTNEFKVSMRTAAPSDQRARLLLRSYPRFLWRATLQTPNRPVAELLFDATDMARSYPFCDAVFYDSELAFGLGAIIREPDLEAMLSELITPQFRNFLLAKTDSITVAGLAS